jgi:hypothetical protein
MQMRVEDNIHILRFNPMALKPTDEIPLLTVQVPMRDGLRIQLGSQTSINEDGSPFRTHEHTVENHRNAVLAIWRQVATVQPSGDETKWATRVYMDATVADDYEFQIIELHASSQYIGALLGPIGPRRCLN